MNFEEELKARTDLCNAIIRKFLPAAEGYRKTVIEAMNYSVEAGGKRLRPMMMLETNAMYGGDRANVEPFMAAIEMIHTYSLVHDDLPEMDNDEYRRGRKTTHAVYGAGMAVIAGDGLLNYAFETVLKACEKAGSTDGSLPVQASGKSTAVCAASIPDAAGKTLTAEERLLKMQRSIRAAWILAENAGIYGMVGGQCADLEAEGAGSHVEPELLSFIHYGKTAAMIDSALTIGAVLAGAPEEDIARLSDIAGKVGVAFQIEDDILDVEGSAAEMGKTLGKDAAEEKTTYVSLYGLDKAKSDVKKLTDEALTSFDALSAQNDFLRELILSLMDRRH